MREAGGGVHLKNLYNDYVYFWRWALWKVFDSTNEGGIVTFITASSYSSYLRGPAFAGMRRKMREVFDELWIIDLEGDNLGARKTENVFAIQIPVAIAIGIRRGEPNTGVPARVLRARIAGTAAEKLGTLDAAERLSGLDWRECATEWEAPLQIAGDTPYFGWPSLIDVFPWQASGVKVSRTWPISESNDVLVRRWRDLTSRPPEARAEPVFRQLEPPRGGPTPR